jgi:putative transposase
MPNHVHLVGEFQSASTLPKFMHDLNRTYVLYFNDKYDKAGHLWQGRFKSKILLKDIYLINCMTYVEFNPLRANLVKDVSKYRWTSYNSRVLGGQDKFLNNLPSI